MCLTNYNRTCGCGCEPTNQSNKTYTIPVAGTSFLEEYRTYYPEDTRTDKEIIDDTLNNPLPTLNSEVTTNYLVNNSSPQYLYVDATSSVVNITFDPIITVGKIFTFKKIDSSVNIVKITAPIDGVTFIDVTDQYQYITIQKATPTQWYIINEKYIAP